ncbi:MAG: hypothetical protein P9F75_16520 [Candidatus Contendobacter sp.]|nr:hypothetical protein [Candidatus Contendobacter sp.]
MEDIIVFKMMEMETGIGTDHQMVQLPLANLDQSHPKDYRNSNRNVQLDWREE